MTRNDKYNQKEEKDMNTRTITLIRGETIFGFAVNPEALDIVEARGYKIYPLLSGDAAIVPHALKPRTVKFKTFLPGRLSPFYTGEDPSVACKTLYTWLTGAHAVSLYIAGALVGNFYIASITRTFKEGDGDTWLALELVSAGISYIEPTVTRPKKVTAVYGDTLYSLARRYYGDGEKWRAISAANGGIKTLSAGKVVVLP